MAEAVRDHFAGLSHEVRSTLQLSAIAERVNRLESPASKPIVLARREALRASDQEMILYLLKVVTPEQLGFMTSVGDRHLLESVAAGRHTQLLPGAKQRLRAAYEIAQMLASRYDSEFIRDWFYRLDPQLNDHQPAEALSQGQLREALSAAQVFIVSG